MINLDAPYLKYAFITYPIPIKGYRYDPYLFFTEKYLEANKVDNCYHFWLADKTANALLHCCTHIVKDEAISISKATFGGIEGIKGLRDEDEDYFLSKVFQFLHNEGVKKVTFRLAPEIYNDYASNNYRKLLERNGFEKKITEIDNYLVVSSTSFREGLDASEKNKLNKAEKNGIVCEQLTGNDFDSFYSLLAENRAKKGYPVTMDSDSLKHMIATFPDDYLLFGARHGDKLVAAVLSIKLHPAILYNFYMADDYDYRSYSPLVMLNGYIYEFAQQSQIGLIDLGISTENGIVNQGLLDFKHHLGAQDCEKLQVQKSL